MADPVVADPPKQPDLSPTTVDFSAEFEPLSIPPLDHQFFSSDDAALREDFFSDLGLGLEENCDYDFTFDDIGDDLYLPSETEEFLIPDGVDIGPNSLSPNGTNSDRDVNPISEAAVAVKSTSPESESSTVSGVRDCDVAGFLNCQSSESGGCNSEYSRNSADRKSKIDGVMDSPSPDCGNCDQECSGEAVSSQGSGNCGSGVSEGANSPAHSGNSDKDVSSCVFVDQTVKVEEVGKNYMSKRKKEPEEGNAESRTPKYRRSSAPAENTHSQSTLNPLSEEEERRKARLMRNRESAQLSRQRKKHYVEELEDKVRSMNSTITDLNSRISYIMVENASLRQQLSGGGICPPPPPTPGMYPHPPMGAMPYPWVPCAPYVVKPQGSQVPLVPIPRLKPQQTVSASKAKKSEGKKSEGGKTKKVASISFLGLLFFVFLFGGLVPMVNVNFGGLTNKVPGGLVYTSGRLYDQHRGMVLTADHLLNGSGENMRVGSFNRVQHERGREQGEKLECGEKERGSQALPGSGEFVRLGNDSEPLVASLYVPRNDKLVKIDGNLIIHSVLASEKAKASLAHSEMKSKTETSLAIARDVAPSYAVPEVGGNRGRHAPMYRNPVERHKALSSGATDSTNDRLKSGATDGKLQQWFREGLAGTISYMYYDCMPVSSVIFNALEINMTCSWSSN